jgi:integrating conjugative element membrane protein (TIGR03747 family)
MQKMQKLQKTQKSPTLLDLWIWLLIRFIFWGVFGCIGCFVVAIVYVVLYGGSGLMLLQAMLQRDYQAITVLAHPNTLFIVHHWINVIPNRINLANLSLSLGNPHYEHEFLLHLKPIICAALLAAKLVIIRLYLLMRWCRLFLLLGLVGLIDGLMQRRIRRLAAGRESALIYHNVKSLIMMSLVLGVFLDLVLPISFKANEWILIGSAILFTFAIQVTAKSFKKYL